MKNLKNKNYSRGFAMQSNFQYGVPLAVARLIRMLQHNCAEALRSVMSIVYLNWQSFQGIEGSEIVSLAKCPQTIPGIRKNI